MNSIILVNILLLTNFFQPLQVEGQCRFSPHQRIQGPNPVISEIVAALNKDSLAAIMQSMVDMGTRFMYADNRREVASMIAGKFRSYGYTMVVLDSFRMVGETVPVDSVWQYNVVATLTGSSAPQEIYIISAHHDDYVSPDPHMPAPGADDNASGCAVAMEIARVLKAKGFQPASTIRFITYAAEELMGLNNYSGSINYADKVFNMREDIRLNICNDGSSYTPDSSYSVWGVNVEDRNSAWAGHLMLASAGQYASLNVISSSFPTPDAYPFHDLGYPVTGFQEHPLSPYYHTNHDSVSNCVMDFCLEIARASCAILLNEQLTPVPQVYYSTTDKSRVNVFWKPTANANVKGYKVYRSTIPDSAFSLIGLVSPGDSSISDTMASNGFLYFYYITSFDNLNHESIPSNLVRGALAPKDRDLLVVKDSRGGYHNPPDSMVNAFYQQIFRDIKYDYSDASVTDSLNLVTLGKYQRIIWLSNTGSDQPNSSFRRNYNDITSYVRNGGQLFIAGFHPTFMIAGNITPDKTFVQADTLWRWYKIQQEQRKANGMLNGAWPCKEEYDSLWIDPEKCLPEPAGHVYNVECIYPTPDATLIYRYNSAYDTTSSHGKMKGKPVGIEYLGDDFKMIILSVPVYYLDSLDAKNLVELVVNEKFRPHVGVRDERKGGARTLSIRSHPNPCNDHVTITYQTGRKADVIIELAPVMGAKVFIRQEGIKENGSYTVELQVQQLPAGVYMLILRSGNEIASTRMVVMR